MSTPSNYLSDVGLDVDLPAGVATPIDLAVDGARDWTFLLANVGASPVTAGTLARSPTGGRFTDAEAFPAGLPLAPGATVPLEGSARPLKTLRLVLTSASGTTVRVEGGGR